MLTAPQVEELQQLFFRMAAILTGAGLIASAPDTAGDNNSRGKRNAKQGNEVLKRKAAIDAGKFLGRTDLINYIKFN